MKVKLLLSILFRFLVLVSALSDVEKTSFTIAATAYQKATGKTLADEGPRRIAFIERWHNGNKALECVAGFTHVLLVVGDTVKQEEASGQFSWGLRRGKVYDLEKADAKIANTEAYTEVKDWIPDTNRGNTYDWKGWVKHSADDEFIEHKMAEYLRARPTYNLVTNNCLSFVNSLWQEIQGTY